MRAPARRATAAQEVVQADARGRGKLGKLALAQFDVQAAAPRDLHAVCQRRGQIREQLRHLRRALEVLLGV
jgi:hypothetical protein